MPDHAQELSPRLGNLGTCTPLRHQLTVEDRTRTDRRFRRVPPDPAATEWRRHSPLRAYDPPARNLWMCIRRKRIAAGKAIVGWSTGPGTAARRRNRPGPPRRPRPVIEVRYTHPPPPPSAASAGQTG